MHIDKFVTGGPEKAKLVRSDGKKKRTLIIVEVGPGSKTGCVYWRKIADFMKDTLYQIIAEIVSIDAKVVTDKYPSYAQLKEQFPKAKPRKSNTGKGFLILHQPIMKRKGWLSGIHHQCSDQPYQKYINEYCFRTIGRNTERLIFRNIMLRVVSIKTKTFNKLSADAA